MEGTEGGEAQPSEGVPNPSSFVHGSKAYSPGAQGILHLRDVLSLTPIHCGFSISIRNPNTEYVTVFCLWYLRWEGFLDAPLPNALMDG